MSDDGKKAVREQLDKLWENISRLTSANDKLEKRAQGMVRSDKEVKDRGRRKDD